MTWFAGSPHETRICPRRHILRNPDVSGALALYRACDGKPGVSGLREMSTHAVAAFAVIDAGHAAKLKDEMKRRAPTEAAPTAPAKPTRRRRK